MDNCLKVETFEVIEKKFRMKKMAAMNYVGSNSSNSYIISNNV